MALLPRHESPLQAPRCSRPHPSCLPCRGHSGCQLRPQGGLRPLQGPPARRRAPGEHRAWQGGQRLPRPALLSPRPPPCPQSRRPCSSQGQEERGRRRDALCGQPPPGERCCRGRRQQEDRCHPQSRQEGPAHPDEAGRECPARRPCRSRRGRGPPRGWRAAGSRGRGS